MHCLEGITVKAVIRMHILFFILALIAIGMIIALVVGVTVKLIGLLFMALIVVLGVTWVMRKIRGPSAKGVAVLDANRSERLRR
jgi:hypothetical protein